ncbi:hypothetical protein D3C80_2140050 [compost metagenome]
MDFSAGMVVLLWLQDDLDAAIVAVAERFIKIRAFIEGGAVGDDEGGVYLSLLDPPQKGG